MADESEGIDIKLSEEDSPADILRESEDISLFADDDSSGEALTAADLKLDDDLSDSEEDDLKLGMDEIGDLVDEIKLDDQEEEKDDAFAEVEDMVFEEAESQNSDSVESALDELGEEESAEKSTDDDHSAGEEGSEESQEDAASVESDKVNEEEIVVETDGSENVEVSAEPESSPESEAELIADTEIPEEPEQSIAISTYNQDKTSLLENHQQQISDLKSLLEKTIEKQQDTINQLIPKVGNTTNYNKMTVNVFLNEKCKNAMNLTDFVEQLHLSFDDVMYTRDNGYIKGITNIFMKNLIGMEPTNRPIHCSDQKRLSFYVKDENKWEKDDKKIQKTISEVSQKQTQQIKEWEKQYPEWNKSDKETEMYLQMVKQVMGGNLEENSEEIKRNISEVIELKNTTIE